MNWINVNDRLPEFEKIVLLYQEINNLPYVGIGYLVSINKAGNNFITFFSRNHKSIYGGAFENLDLTPTKWCEIEIPSEN